jgi:ferredoxin-NADP reductase
VPAPVEWRTGLVRSIRDLTLDIHLFEIDPGPGYPIPAPGSHVKVSVDIAGRADTRSYSTVGACTDGVCRIAVKRLADSRGGSAYMWRLHEGARLALSTPANHFPLRHGRAEYLLVAGGIGITPIHGMALALARAGARVRVLYAARSRADMAFADELRQHLGERLVLAAADEGSRIDLTEAFARLHAEGEAYVCGPIGMLEGAKAAWAAAGRPIENLRFETFGSSGRYATAPFTVRIPRLGKEIQVPRNQSMLEALEAAGVAMIHDCRRGECGLCALRIVEADGVVDHRDVFFSDAEKAANAKLCTCVSRMASGTLTIDTADRPA